MKHLTIDPAIINNTFVNPGYMMGGIMSPKVIHGKMKLAIFLEKKVRQRKEFDILPEVFKTQSYIEETVENARNQVDLKIKRDDTSRD